MSAFAECDATLFVIEKFVDGLDKSMSVFGFDQATAFAVFYSVFESIKIAGDHGAFADSSFYSIDTKAFHGAGDTDIGRNDDVGGIEKSLHVTPGEVFHKMHARLKVQIFYGLLTTREKISVTSFFGTDSTTGGDEDNVVAQEWHDVSNKPLYAFVLHIATDTQDYEFSFQFTIKEFFEITSRAVGDNIFGIDAIGDEYALRFWNTGLGGAVNRFISHSNKTVEVFERGYIDESIHKTQEALLLSERNVESVNDRRVYFVGREKT